MKLYSFKKNDIDNIPFNVTGFLGTAGTLNWTAMSADIPSYFTISTGLTISEVGYDLTTKIAVVRVDSSGGTIGSNYTLTVKFLTTDGRVRNAKAKIIVTD